jgi:hypothetical protein
MGVSIDMTVIKSNFVFALSLLILTAGASADEQAYESLAFSSSANRPGFAIHGQDARHQLIVHGQVKGGKIHDLTRKVKFKISPEGIFEIDATGLVKPLADGKAKVTAIGPNGVKAEIEITVVKFNNEAPVNFPNQVAPIFTKLACNSGGCHGKASGQNGFKLSLLGFEPTEDYEYLVREGRGRRLFPAAPDSSLLLTKATNTTPHGGGARLKKDSHDYRLIRRWISQGMPYGSKDDPTVVKIQVEPAPRLMPRDGQQQIRVLAHYSDGSIEDVTRTAQFEANDKDMSEVSEEGVVDASGVPGDIAVMVRYMGNVGVYRATVPLGIANVKLPEPRNFIDKAVFDKLALLGMPASQVCDDSTFIRRTSIDIAGRLPSTDETKSFLDSKDPSKRDKWIDYLLASTDYADYFANKWSAVLRNKRRKDSFKRGTFGFHEWIRQSMNENKPYDQFVRQIVAASGDMGRDPSTIWYREVKKRNEQMEDVSQLFLGVRIQCAQCHHHPFERWSQNDYYGFAAYFSQVGRKKGPGLDEERIYHKRGTATASNPKNNVSLKPTGLGSEPEKLSSFDDPRHALVDWMSRKDNPFFAPALVNRYWKHFFSRGIVDPEDDMRATNPATNPQLLAGLSKHFIDSKFDMKDLVRQICQSKTYQLTSLPNKHNGMDKNNFSRFYPRRLNAEVLLDAIDAVTGTKTRFSGLPASTRAVQIPDSGVQSYFLTVFGKPEGSSACECERTGDANLAQSLHLLNSQEIQGKLTSGRAGKFASDTKRPDEDKIRELYMITFSRQPDASELALAMGHIKKLEKKKKEAFEDIIWALINTKEFMFNH